MIKFSKWKVPPIGGSSAPLIIYTVGDAPAWAGRFVWWAVPSAPALSEVTAPLSQDRVTGKIRSLAYEAAQSHRIDRIGAGTERHLVCRERSIVRGDRC